MGMNTAAVQRLYVAYFNRPADPVSLAVYEAMLPSDRVATQAELLVVAETYFSPSAEYTTNFDGKSNSQVVDLLYQNIFGRSAEAEGLISWATKLTDGSITVAELALQLSYSAQGTDATVVDARIEAATTFTNNLDTAEEITGYSGDAAAAEGKKYLAQISGTLPTTDEAITAQKDAAITNVDASISAAVAAGNAVAGESYTLTSNTDNIVGTANNDTITGSSSTFNSDDVIDGKGGTDTLTVTAAGAASVIGNLTDVENVRVTNSAAGNYQVNLIGATGIETVTSRLSSGQVSFDNLQSMVTVEAFGVQSGTINASFLNALASGTADTISLKSTDSIVTFAVSGTTDTNEFETVNLESLGSTGNTVTLTDDGANNLAGIKTLNVTGSGKLTMTMTGGATAGAAFSAENATGVQAITFGGNFTSYTLGSKDDTLTTASFLGNTAPKTVVGGDGTDTLVLTESVANLDSNTTGVSHSVSGVETLNVSAKVLEGDNADKALSLDASKFTGVDTLLATIDNEDTGNTDTASVTFTGITTETVQFTAQEDNTQGVLELDVTLKTTTGTSDEINVVSNARSSSGLNKLDTLTVTGNVEVLNLTANTADVTASGVTTAGTTIAALAAGQSHTVNISGAGGVAINALEVADPAGTTTALIDASTATGNLVLGTASADFKTTNADTVSVKFGSGTNAVYGGTEWLASDVVTGSTGTDTVYITEGNDSGTATEFTVTSVDTVSIEVSGTAGHDGPVSAKNYTDVSKIQVTSADDGAGNENLSVTNLGSGQKVELATITGDTFQADTITLSNVTGVTTLDVDLAGKVALHSGGVGVTTNATSVTLNDKIKDATSFSEDAKVTLAGTSSAAKIDTVTLTGGGASSATATATFTLAGTSNVDAKTIDATALSSNLDITGVTTAALANVTLGSGNNTVTVAIADLVRDALVLDGGDGSDKMVAADLAGDYRPGTTSVETYDLDLTTGTATTLNLADTTGVTTIELDLDSTDENFTISNASSVTAYKVEAAAAATSDIITLGSAATLALSNVTAALGDANTSLVTPDATDLTVKVGKSSAGVTTAAIDLTTLTAAKATTITLGGTDVDSATSAEFIGKIDIATLSAAAATTLTIDADQGDVVVATVTATKLATVNISGDNAVTLGSSGGTTAITSIAGGAATGAITIGDALDMGANASVVTGTGDDTISINVLTEATAAVDMGEKASDNDTYKLVGANNLGLTVINLAAADQMSQLNGAVDSQVQTGIESVDGSSLSGSFGINVTGNDDANTIVGSANADNLVGGEGIDSISGLAGADSISLTESTAKADTVTFANVANIKSTADTITGMTSADNIAIQATAAGQFADLHDTGGTGFNGATTGAVATYNVAGGSANLTASKNVIAINANTGNLALGYANFAAINTAVTAAEIKESGGGTFADGDELMVVFYNTTTTTYDIGIVTIAGGDGFAGGDESFEHLASVDASSGITLAEVAASIDYVA